MGSVIVAIPNADNSRNICDILRKRGFTPDLVCSLGDEVLRYAGGADYGIVICARKLKDMSCRELYEYLPKSFQVLMIGADTGDFVSLDGLLRLTPPFKASDLVNTVDMMLSDLESMIARNKKPSRSLEDKKIIEKAKLLLMDRNDMTEPEAFRYIQKVSMDTGRKMVESAEMVLMLNWDR